MQALVAPFCLFWGVGCLSLLSIDCARRLVGDEDVLDALVAALVLGTSIALGSLWGLHAIDALGPLALCAPLTALTAIERLVPGAPRLGLGRITGSARLETSAAAALLGGSLAIWLVPLLTGTRFVWDDLAYHAAIAASWFQNASLAYPVLTYQVYYPLNAELLSYCFLLLGGTMGVANLGIAVGLALTTASLIQLHRHLGTDVLAAGAALAGFLATPLVVAGASSFSGHDIIGASFVLAAIALLAGKPTIARYALVGLALGLAVGTRASLPLPAAVVALAAAARSPRHALGLASAALTGTFWYVRNTVFTGNPIYPAEVGPFMGPFTADAQAHTRLVNTFLSDPQGALSVLAKLVDWPWPLAVLAAAGGCIGLVQLRNAPGRFIRSLLLAVALVELLSFPLSPFSATVNRPPDLAFYGTTIPLRRLLLTFSIGWLFLPGLVPIKPAWARWTFAAGVLVTVLASGGLGVAWITGFIGVALAAVLLRNTAIVVPTVPVAVAIGAAIAVSTPFRADQTHRNLIDYANNRPILEAWETLEELPAGARVAVFSSLPSSHNHYLPLFSSDLDLVPVAVHANGRPRKLLHREPIRPWWFEFRENTRSLTSTELLDNLIDKAEVDYLLLTKWPLRRGRKPPWPPQYKILDSGGHRSAQIAKNNGYATIIDLHELRASRHRAPQK